MARLPEPSEHSIQLGIQQYLTLKGIYHWRNNSGALPDRNGRIVRFGKAGSADILGVQSKTGKIVAIEVKKPSTRKDTTLLQREFLTAVHKCGGLSGVATSEEDVDKILSGEFLLPV